MELNTDDSHSAETQSDEEGQSSTAGTIKGAWSRRIANLNVKKRRVVGRGGGSVVRHRAVSGEKGTFREACRQPQRATSSL